MLMNKVIVQIMGNQARLLRESIFYVHNYLILSVMSMKKNVFNGLI